MQIVQRWYRRNARMRSNDWDSPSRLFTYDDEEEALYEACARLASRKPAGRRK